MRSQRVGHDLVTEQQVPSMDLPNLGLYQITTVYIIFEK